MTFFRCLTLPSEDPTQTAVSSSGILNIRRAWTCLNKVKRSEDVKKMIRGLENTFCINCRSCDYSAWRIDFNKNLLKPYSTLRVIMKKSDFLYRDIMIGTRMNVLN